MLILVTGLPGASKTLNSLKLINENPLYKASDDFPNGRQVYFHGIKEVKMEGWLELEDAEKWMECPVGSIILIDEAHKKFPVRKSGANNPKHVEDLAEHRHSGYDIWMVTQHPGDLDLFIRRRANRHYHLKRINDSKMVRMFMWNEYKNPDTPQSLNSATEEKSIKIDKKYFGMYKSTEIDTHKTRIPWKLIRWMSFFTLFIVLILIYIFNFMFSSQESKSDVDIVKSENQIVQERVDERRRSNPYDSESYRPRIQNLAYTAPVYDDLFIVRSKPKVSCVYSSNLKCICYTQQLTRVKMEFKACKNYVDNGVFDPTIADVDKDEEDNDRFSKVVDRAVSIDS